MKLNSKQEEELTVRGNDETGATINWTKFQKANEKEEGKKDELLTKRSKGQSWHTKNWSEGAVGQDCRKKTRATIICISLYKNFL